MVQAVGRRLGQDHDHSGAGSGGADISRDADFVIEKDGSDVIAISDQGVVSSGSGAGSVFSDIMSNDVESGDLIRFENTEFTITNQLEVRNDCIVDFNGCTIKIDSGSSFDMIKNRAGSSLEVEMYNGTLDGNGVATRVVQSTGDGFKNGIFRNIHFIEGSNTEMVVQGSLVDFSVTDCLIERGSPSGADGIGYDDGSIRIVDNKFINAFAGTGGAEDVVICNNVFQNTTDRNNGVLLENAYDKDIQKFTISDNVFVKADLGLGTTGASSTGKLKDVVIEGNVLRRGNIEVNSGPNQYENIDVLGNVVVDSPVAGIFARNCKDVVIRDNIVENSNFKDDSNNTNKGCIRVEKLEGRHIVSGNLMFRTNAKTNGTPYGIGWDKGGGKIIVKDNSIRDMNNQVIRKDTDPSSGVVIRGNDGYVTENRGSDTQSGDGSTSVFTITHNLDETPSYASVEASSEDASTDFYISDITSSSIKITYAKAPASGTDNLSWEWRAEV